MTPSIGPKHTVMERPQKNHVICIDLFPHVIVHALNTNVEQVGSTWNSSYASNVRDHCGLSKKTLRRS